MESFEEAIVPTRPPKAASDGPCDFDAEGSLLACAVILPEVLPTIPDNILCGPLAQEVHGALRDMAAEGKLAPNSEGVNLYEVGRRVTAAAKVWIDAAFLQVPSAANAPYWLDLLTELANQREVLVLKDRLTHVAGDPAEVALIARALREIAGRASSSPVQTAASLIPRMLQELEEAMQLGGKLRGFRTGFPSIDRWTSGLEAKRLYIVAARPSVGKSCYLTRAAMEATKDGAKVVFFTLEMPGVEVVTRATQIESQVASRKFEAGTATPLDFDRWAAGCAAVRGMPIEVVDTEHTLHKIIGRAEQAVAQRGANLVVVDYLQRIGIHAFRQNRTALITEVSGALKNLAMTANVPVLCAAQLSRSPERESRHPALSDLRDSGSIEQDADAVLFLHRTEDDVDTATVNACLAKNRRGPTGSVSLVLNKPVTTFREESMTNP